MTEPSVDRIVLTRSQMALVAALDAVGLGFLYTDGAVILFVSEACARLVGRSVEEILKAEDPYLFIAAEDRERMRAFAIARLTGRSTPDVFGARVVRPDGTRSDVEFAVESVPTDSGRVHVISFVADLSGPRFGRAFELRAMMRAIIGATPDPIMILASSGELVFANPAAHQVAPRLGLLRLAGNTPEQVLAAAQVDTQSWATGATREEDGPTTVNARAANVRYAVQIYETPGGTLLWWRPASERRTIGNIS